MKPHWKDRSCLCSHFFCGTSPDNTIPPVFSVLIWLSDASIFSILSSSFCYRLGECNDSYIFTCFAFVSSTYHLTPCSLLAYYRIIKLKMRCMVDDWLFSNHLMCLSKAVSRRHKFYFAVILTVKAAACLCYRKKLPQQGCLVEQINPLSTIINNEKNDQKRFTPTWSISFSFL